MLGKSLTEKLEEKNNDSQILKHFFNVDDSSKARDMLAEVSQEVTPVEDSKSSDSESGEEELASVSVSKHDSDLINDESDPNERIYLDRMGTIDRRDAQNLSSIFKWIVDTIMALPNVHASDIDQQY